MTEFLKTRTGANLLFTLGGVLLISHFFWGDALGTNIVSYDVIRICLMALIVGLVLFIKPNLGFWVIVLFALLLLRFFFGDYLEARVSWYGIVSFLFIGLTVLIVVITEIGTFFKRN